MLRFVLTVLVVTFFVGCESDSNPTKADGSGNGGFSGGNPSAGGGTLAGGHSGANGQATPKELESIKEKLLVANFNAGAVASLQELKTSTEDLVINVDSLCSTGNVSSFEELQETWQQAARAFHRLAPVAIKPLPTQGNPEPESFDEDLGFVYSMAKSGSDLAIDREIDRAFNNSDSYRPRRPTPWVLGIGAVEYVIFARVIDSQKGSLGECTYLKYVTKDLFDRVEQLNDRWLNEVDAHLKSLDGRIRQRDYLSALVSQITVFTDKVVKDRKMAAPLGIKVTEGFQCEPGVNCHEFFLEHPYARLNHLGIEENLWVLASLFEGSDAGLGFNDLLFAQGIAQGTLPSEQFFQVFKAWQLLPEDLNDLALSYGEKKDSNNQLYQAYLGLKKINDWMKTDFVVDMNTELPGSVQGDND